MSTYIWIFRNIQTHHIILYSFYQVFMVFFKVKSEQIVRSKIWNKYVTWFTTFINLSHPRWGPKTSLSRKIYKKIIFQNRLQSIKEAVCIVALLIASLTRVLDWQLVGYTKNTLFCTLARLLCLLCIRLVGFCVIFLSGLIF